MVCSDKEQTLKGQLYSLGCGSMRESFNYNKTPTWAGLLLVQGVSNTDVSEIGQYNGSNLKELEQ